MEHRKLISTKADTLFALRSLIHESVIEEMYILQVGDYHRDKIGVCHEIMDPVQGKADCGKKLFHRRRFFPAF